MTSVLVARGQSHIVKVEVTTVGSILKWEFLTENYDIKFGITLDKNEVVSHVTIK